MTARRQMAISGAVDVRWAVVRARVVRPPADQPADVRSRPAATTTPGRRAVASALPDQAVLIGGPRAPMTTSDRKIGRASCRERGRMEGDGSGGRETESWRG